MVGLIPGRREAARPALRHSGRGRKRDRAPPGRDGRAEGRELDAVGADDRTSTCARVRWRGRYQVLQTLEF